ncbi:AMP-dependent synthetase/ligase [Penicillium macrosclerotiorum]|uniref:AMP-dependent synthetase/ligase n=1 Tax=Penicillium macrosclerotiorum TaxID=303699 RepID=UPI00254683A2|nr:AMP-dependent synthetase/ligase [Penicillium macrosclerotiorum]KAJ5698089.1 AMP-dependent synthetase/ligase [Penicillium macrosclerotiorum]
MFSRSLVTQSLRPRMRAAQARLTLVASRRLLSTSNQLLALPNIPIFRALKNHDPASLAVVHSASGRSFTYGDLTTDVLRAKEDLEHKAARVTGKLAGERVAFLAENSYDYVVTLLATFACDAIALPLSPSFPTSELQYIMDNSSAKVLLATEKYADKANQILQAGLQYDPLFDIRPKLSAGAMSNDVIELEDTNYLHGGMMLYTSGTTNRPKGVLIPKHTLTAQAKSLIEAWKYSPQDRLLHLLPLHHIHGVVNAIITPLFAGSSIEFLYPFNPEQVWRRLAASFLPPKESTPVPSKVTFLTAVPTVYNRLRSSFPSLPGDIQPAAQEAIAPANLRLNISGSAALPTPTKAAWQTISNGNVLLERFGMTEVGMALSCGLDFADRVDGSVGWPLPNVEARLVDTETNEVIPAGGEMDARGREREGEIQLRGPTIFQEYWGNASATRESFVAGADGGADWFCTGDIATRREVKGAGQGRSGAWATGPMYFIQGRKSVDIIKTGGEKVSALEVERELLSLPQVAEAAVVGLPSDQWGHKVAAVIVLHADAQTSGRNGRPWGPMDMRRALKDRLAAYKIPQEMKVLDTIPRNAMGKVNKKALVKQVFDV